MSTVLQLSDPHFGTEEPRVVEALLQLAREQSPEVVIISGDVTQRARRSQFEAALAFLKRMPTHNLLVVPGNHDIPLFNILRRLLCPYAGHCRTFGAELQPQFESEDLLVLGTNTTHPSRHTVGKISAEQIERISKRLSAAAAHQLRIVVTHQPVQVTSPRDVKHLLRNRQAAVRAWSAAGADLILAGHTHLPHVHPLQEAFPDLPHPVWSVLAGTALSTRRRGDIPNSVNIIRYDHSDTPPCCTVERWDHDSRDAFVLAASHLLHLKR